MRIIAVGAVIQAVVDGTLKPGPAAERLDQTVRQVRRLVRRVQAEGAAGLASRRYGRPSNNRTPPNLVKQALDIIRA
ncbi:helix-turn-helix domain-containing protein, partial [Noviherbaspirillum sp.]|uniref:helix-turn-helix domain-containing protein n=1 Tax=Noviherbaspirillum sp. TaxID=1926288 RepID=UPI002D560591